MDVNEENQKIIYNYYDVPIYPNQYIKSLSNGGYIEITYKSQKSISDPNLTYIPSNHKYKIEKLYVLKKSLNIDNIDYDGELIIEHSPITNGHSTLYTCLLLKTMEGVSEENVIDRMIEQSFRNSITLNLNHFLENNKSCLSNEEKSFFIFTSPILISSRFDQFSNSSPFAFLKYDKKKFTKINTFNKNKLEDDNNENEEGFENKENEESTNYEIIDCTPIDKSDSTVEMYTFPVNSDVSNNISKINMLNTSMNFFVFLLLIFLSGFLSPFMYKNGIVEIIKKNYSDINNVNKAASNLKGADIFVVFILILLPITITISGINNKNTTTSYFGIFLFIYMLISISMISVLKIMYKSEYTLSNDFNIPYIFDFVGDIIQFIGDNKTNIFYLLFGYTSILILLAFVLWATKSFDKDKKKNTNIRNSMIGNGMVYGVIACIYFAYIFKT